jgi:hypothetical protein
LLIKLKENIISRTFIIKKTGLHQTTSLLAQRSSSKADVARDVTLRRQHLRPGALPQL